MKVVIDIDKQHFELLQMAVMNGLGDNAQKIIAQGIPLDEYCEVQPEPFINKPCVSEQVCHEDKIKVLDKIRAEIHETAEMHEDGDYYIRDEWIDEYFDKYKAESEG